MRGSVRDARAAVLAILLLATSCSEAAPTPSARPIATETPNRGGQLVLGLSTDIVTLQPIIAIDNPSASVWSLIYASLLTDDPATGELRPALAERFASSADGKRITYALRAGLVWSDGTPLTGDDYKYTLEAIARSKKTVDKSLFQDVVGWDDYVSGRDDSLRGIQILDAGRTIQIDLRRGRCAALRDMAYPPIPRARFLAFWNSNTHDSATNIDDAPINRAPPVASGPFVFAEYRPGDQIRLDRNDRYYKGAPLLDAVVFRIFPDQTQMRLALLAGEIAQAQVNPADVDDTRTRMGAHAVEYRISGATGFTYFGFNERSPNAPWLADKRVRQALWYGLDIETAIRVIYQGYAHRVLTHTPQTSWAYDPTGLERYDFDPKRARSLLETAGATLGADGYYRWRDGRLMEMKMEVGSNTAARVTFVQAAQEQYRTIGIKVNVAVEPFNALVSRLTAHDLTMDGYIVTWGVSPDLSDTYELWHSSQIANGPNHTGFSDPGLDRSVDAGLFGPDCSTAARRAAYHQMDLILNDAAPYVFLFSNDLVQFRNTKLVAPPPLPFGSRYDIEKWWLRP